MGIFWVLSGCSLELSSRAILYAAILAIIVLFSYFTQIPVYRHLDVAEVGVFSTGGRLVLSMLLGAALFGEKITTVSVLRIALMIAAAILLFVDARRHAPQKSSAQHRSRIIGLLLCLGLIVNGTFSAALSKYIALDALVPDANSLFFMTNVITASASILCLLVCCRGKIRSCVAEFRVIAPFQYLMILTTTVTSNLNSLLGVLILKQDHFSLYVPLAGAIGILSTEAISVFILHERPRVLPVVLACCAMLLSFFE